MGIDEPSRGLRFGIESLREFCIEHLMHPLDCDDAGKTELLSSVDGRHPAPSDFGHDLVATLEGMTH